LIFHLKNHQQLTEELTQMNSNVFISVIMSVFNGQDYLNEAIESVLRQTFRDFEFIIIDDGSTDNTRNIIKHYQKKENRIKAIYNDNNKGLALCLNEGIQMAKGKYIARMDADDISLPERFAAQIAYLEKNPQFWILGCNIFLIDEKGNRIKETSFPSDSSILRWNMLFGTTGLVCHPCAMMLTEKIKESGCYTNIKSSQDMDLWSRFFLIDPLPINNLQIPLVNYRGHENRFSMKHSLLQHQVSSQIRLNTINFAFKRDYDLKMVEAYRNLEPQKNEYLKKDLIQYMTTWLEVLDEFKSMFKLSNSEVKDYYAQILYKMRNYTSLNPLALFNSHRVWLPELMPKIGIKRSMDLFVYKLKRLKQVNC